MSTMFGVEELRSAYLALRDSGHGPDPLGQAAIHEPRGAASASATPRGASMVCVAGVAGGAGTTTVALALAEAMPAAALIEQALPRFSGLSDATSVELGIRDGWNVGRRSADELVIYRNIEPETPLPVREEGQRFVVDLGVWPAGEALLEAGSPLVLVAPCSVPGLRRLEATLQELQNQLGPSAPIPVVMGARRVLPKQLQTAFGPRLRSEQDRGRLVLFPEHAPLRVSGLTASPLPRSFQQAAGALVHLLEDSDVD